MSSAETNQPSPAPSPYDYNGYPVDFMMPLRNEAWGVGEEERPCPLCGKRWVPSFNSRLPCHAICLFTDLGLARLVFDEKVSIDAHAARLGVTAFTVRSVYRKALRRRAELEMLDLPLEREAEEALR